MSDNKQVTTMHFPILGILGLIFITLKLTGYIAWSWVWVLAPFWIPVALGVLLLVVVGALIVSRH